MVLIDELQSHLNDMQGMHSEKEAECAQLMRERDEARVKLQHVERNRELVKIRRHYTILFKLGVDTFARREDLMHKRLVFGVWRQHVGEKLETEKQWHVQERMIRDECDEKIHE